MADQHMDLDRATTLRQKRTPDEPAFNKAYGRPTDDTCPLCEAKLDINIPHHLRSGDCPVNRGDSE